MTHPLEGRPDRPNIIFILADDMGIGDLSCYGAEKIRTPYMDEIARGGVRFTDAHATSSICTPSRYSIMTGRYCWKAGLEHSVIKGFAPPLVEPGRPTVASVLRGAGYRTGAFGKWHLGLEWTQKDGRTVREATGGDIRASGYDGFAVDYARPLGGGPLDRGFDRWFGISGSLDMPPYCFIEDRQTVGIPAREKREYHNQSRGLEADYWREEEVDTTFARKAVEFIEESCREEPGRPFFLYLAAAAPHSPCNRRPGFIAGKSAAGDRGDMVCLVDWMVGQVSRALRRLGLEENTLVVVTSDNGAVAACENGLDYGHRSNGDYRGYKRDIWEGGHREPLVVRWPAAIPPGTVCPDLVGLHDFFLTFAEIARVPVPEGAAEDGVSILPCLRAPERGARPRESIIHHSGNGLFSIRRGKWKLVDGLGSGGNSEPYWLPPPPGGPAGQLYDLERDPFEKVNLWTEHPRLAAELLAEIEAAVSPYFDRRNPDIMRALDPRLWGKP